MNLHCKHILYLWDRTAMKYSGVFKVYAKKLYVTKGHLV